MDKLKIVKEQLNILAVPYEFGEWTKAEQYPYWVGEITEHPTITEDGCEESTLILTGTHKGKRIDLETFKESIKKHFDQNFGFRAKTDSGSIAVFFDGSFYVPTGVADLCRIQINLKILEWKGAN